MKRYTDEFMAKPPLERAKHIITRYDNVVSDMLTTELAYVILFVGEAIIEQMKVTADPLGMGPQA